MMTRIKSQDEIAAMRESGHMLATVLAILKSKASVGMSTKQLANMAASELKGLGGQPAFLGYYGFPDVLCVSLNDEVVHGIPRADTILADGDVLSMDFGVTHRGMITDAAITTIVGNAKDKDVKEIVKVTEEALNAGIGILRDKVRVGDISHAVQSVLERHKFGIVRDYVGHGVGNFLHEEPNIPNYGRKGTGSTLMAGMTIAIEPMSTLGGHRVTVERDGWTVRTEDHSLAAHFEHTVLITETGSEVLTRLS